MCVCRMYTCIDELLLNIVRKRDTTAPLRGGSDRSSASVLQKREKNRTKNVKTGVNVCILYQLHCCLQPEFQKRIVHPYKRTCRLGGGAEAAAVPAMRIDIRRGYLNISHVGIIIFIYHNHIN